jgi:hypothetical protein
MRLPALRLALALSLATPALAGAQDAAPAPDSDAAAAEAAGLPLPDAGAERAEAAERARAEEAFARLGLLVDAGFPEGAAVSVVWRPVPQIRIFAGPAFNVVAWGAQAGVTIVPWHLGLSPVLSLEGGRYFAPDAGYLARSSSGIPDELEPLLHDVAYDYAALHVGLELGTRDGLAVSLRVGLARVWLDAPGTATYVDEDSGAVVSLSDPSLRGTLPSVKLGLQLWF